MNQLNQLNQFNKQVAAKLQFLAGKNPNFSCCPLCSSKEFKLKDRPYYLLSFDEVSKGVVSSEKAYNIPVAVLTCEECGYTYLLSVLS